MLYARKMKSQATIYILGSGAVGSPLAVYLANAGRTVIAVRTTTSDVPKSTKTISAHNDSHQLSAPIETISLAQLPKLEGIIVIATKSYANKAIALQLKEKAATSPIVMMQNGLGVEKPFLEAQFAEVYRCVLYVTSQASSENHFLFRPVTSSPIGIISGNQTGLQQCVDALHTPKFPFRAESNIQREIWKKVILNAVFNSICPLLNIDNGVFARDQAVAELARELVLECITLTEKLGLDLQETEVMEQIMLVSKRSNGQLISTLQDINLGRPTEIESLNLEIARVALLTEANLQLPKIELLGKMILAKSSQKSM